MVYNGNRVSLWLERVVKSEAKLFGKKKNSKTSNIFLRLYTEFLRLNVHVWDLNGKKMLVVPEGPPKGTIKEF